MKARIVVTTTLAALFAGVLPAKAADPQLLNLVMPDVKVLAGVNVEQAKATPFGQYVLMQVQTNDQDLKKLEAMTGFDPTRDVRELLVASNANTGGHQGLFLARGTFDPARIQALAAEKGGATEVYNGVTIILDPKKSGAVAFLDSTLVVAGDVANVKAAIDRQNMPSILSPALNVLITQWSGSQDAWAISAVPPSQLHPPSTAPNIPGMNGQGVFQAVQSAAGGVKFGSLVVVSALVQADTAQNAQSIGDTVKLLANLAMMQSQNDPNVADLAKSLTVSTSGSAVNLSVSLPEDQIQGVLKPKATVRKKLQGRM